MKLFSSYFRFPTSHTIVHMIQHTALSILTDKLIEVAQNTISISKSCKKQIEKMKEAFAENNFKDATTGKITTSTK